MVVKKECSHCHHYNGGMSTELEQVKLYTCCHCGDVKTITTKKTKNDLNAYSYHLNQLEHGPYYKRPMVKFYG